MTTYENLLTSSQNSHQHLWSYVTVGKCWVPSDSLQTKSPDQTKLKLDKQFQSKLVQG